MFVSRATGRTVRTGVGSLLNYRDSLLKDSMPVEGQYRVLPTTDVVLCCLTGMT